MDASAKNVIGSIIYFIGMMMIILPIIAFIFTGGMVILTGPVFLSLPILGAIPTVVGKKMMIEAKRLADEERANDELRRAANSKIPPTSDNTKV